MKHYTIEEKEFIAKYRPIVEVESIEFGHSVETMFDEAPALEMSFASEAGYKTHENDEECDVLWATIHFRDRGADFEKKYVAFYNFAQVFCMDDERKVSDYTCDMTPRIWFQESADKDGRFSVSVPLWVRPYSQENEDLLDYLCKNKASFTFNKVVVKNEFVCEEFEMLNGMMAEGGKTTDLSVWDISHSLADEQNEDDGTEEINPVVE